MKSTFKEIITSEKELREIMGETSELATRKTIDHIDENSRIFINQSPFILIASSDLKGNFDISPKGDPSGFVKVLDKNTIAIPDRLGNRRADTFMNVLQNPNVGLIFLIPGIKETLRVSGEAQIVTDNNVLELLNHKGKLPKFALIINVKEVFMHCAKCIIRSKLWANIDTKSKRIVPTLAKSLVDSGKLDKSYEEIDQIIKNDEETELY
ncbi:MAG: PPOX class probable FMN-dependent enzyme [Polaribacter sp.]|jgi:PPOX class probable FMN-dependent enzyme